MSTGNISLERQFYEHDLLFVFLREKLRFSPASVMIVIALIMGVVQGVDFALAGRVSLVQAVIGIFFQSFLVAPMGIYLYFVVPGFLAKPFLSMQNANSNGKKGGVPYDVFIKKMNESISSLVWIVLAVLSVVLYWRYRLSGNVPDDSTAGIGSHELQMGMRIALLLVYSTPLYMGIITICRTLVGLIFIGRLFRSFKITADPINPDGAGGIGYVGQMLVTSVLIATAFGAGAIGLAYVAVAGFNIANVNDALKRPEVIVLSSIYIVLTPLLFYSLLWSPHKALLNARDEILKPLADEFQRESAAPIPAGKRNARALKLKTDRLVEIKRQYELIRDSFPHWPLDTNSLRNLVTTSILPVITTVFSGPVAGLWNLITTFLRTGIL